MSTYLEEYGDVPVGLMRLDGDSKSASPPPVRDDALPRSAQAPAISPMMCRGVTADGFMARLERAESNDEARQSQRLSLISCLSSSAELARSSEAAPIPPRANTQLMASHSSSSSECVRSSAEEAPPPPMVTRFPDDVGAPKWHDFASNFRGLTTSLSGRPY